MSLDGGDKAHADGGPLRKGGLRLLLLVIILALALFAIYRAGVWEILRSEEEARRILDELGLLAPLIYILIYAVAPALLIPGSVLSIASGKLFGALFGTIYTVIGATIGASVAFYVARSMGRGFVEGRLRGRLLEFDEAAGRHGFKVILYMRLVPLFPYIGINYGAGLSTIKFRDFLPATLVGIIPATFLLNFFGSNIADPSSPAFWISLALVAALILVPTLVKRARREKSPGLN